MPAPERIYRLGRPPIVKGSEKIFLFDDANCTCRQIWELYSSVSLRETILG